jgi:rRNA maturation protein Nop10
MVHPDTDICVDSAPVGATDKDGDTCSDWLHWVSIGVQCDDAGDDSDFTLADMCCICGGGSSHDDTGTPADDSDVTSQTDADAYCADSAPEDAADIYSFTCSDYVTYGWECEDTYDDSDFTLMDMCCHCGGGQPDA